MDFVTPSAMPVLANIGGNRGHPVLRLEALANVQEGRAGTSGWYWWCFAVSPVGASAAWEK
jgi:hypothetical protein